MKIYYFLFLLTSCTALAQLHPINVVDLNFRIPSMSEHKLAYGFAAGDKVILNYSEERGKKLKNFVINEYQANNVYSDFNVVEIADRELIIKKSGIYIFTFTNSSLARRICNFKIDRIPASEDKISFNSTVKKRTVTDTTYTTQIKKFVKNESYQVKEVVTNQKFFINSGSNAIFKSGKSRVALPIQLPSNTIKWYYTISSSREESIVSQVKSNINLVSELTSLLDIGGTANIAIDLLSQPPGPNYCDVYLLNHENLSPFLTKLEYSYKTIGTRENIVSANVEIPYSSSENLYLGIRNPDASHGINVMISVAAIIIEQKFDTKEVKTPNISQRVELYLDN